jgi:hypothetical protein
LAQAQSIMRHRINNPGLLIEKTVCLYSSGDSCVPRSSFGFLEGTDLEVVLLLQARRGATGPRWEYALARMSDFTLKVQFGERTVWKVDRSQPDQSRAAYYCSTVESRDSPDDK